MFRRSTKGPDGSPSKKRASSSPRSVQSDVGGVTDIAADASGETSTAEATTVVGLNDESINEARDRRERYREGGAHLSKKEEKLPPLAPADRKCTDVLFLLLFFVYWIGMLAIGFIGFQNGDPNRLIYGTDSAGVVCGGDQKPDEPFVVYPRMSKDVMLAGSSAIDAPWDISFFSVCTDKCPKSGEVVCTDEAEALIVDVADGDSRDTVIRECIPNVGNSALSELAPTLQCRDNKIRSGCFETLFNTTSILFRCFPLYLYTIEDTAESACTRYSNVTTALGKKIETCVRYRSVKKITREEPTETNVLFDSFNTAAQFFNRLLADVVISYPVILACGIGFSASVGLMYILSLWCCVGLMVWLSVMMCIAVSLLFTLYCYFKSGIIESDELDRITQSIRDAALDTSVFFNGESDSLNDTLSGEVLPPQYLSRSTDYTREFEVAAYVSSAFTVLLVIIVILMWARIRKAIEIFSEASAAVRANPFLIMVAPISMIALVVAVFYWTFATAYIASSGSYDVEYLNQSFPVSPEDTLVEVKVFGGFTYTNLFMGYLLMGTLWTLQFFNGIGVMTISGTVGAWYWSGSKAENKYGNWPVMRSFYTTMRFHMGTIAFGSLLVAIIQMIRYIAAYIQARAAKLKKDNQMIRVVFCLVHCFLACVETCVKFISRNSYIMCALYGDNFCVSTKQAFFAIASNIAQVATVTFLGDIIKRLGQFMIASLAGLACWMYLDNNSVYRFGGEKELSSFIWPVSLAMILAWYIGGEVLAVYDVCVDTILLSYCQDRKLSKHRMGHKQMASASFRGFMKKNRRRGDSVDDPNSPPEGEIEGMSI